MHFEEKFPDVSSYIGERERNIWLIYHKSTSKKCLASLNSSSTVLLKQGYRTICSWGLGFWAEMTIISEYKNSYVISIKKTTTKEDQNVAMKTSYICTMQIVSKKWKKTVNPVRMPVPLVCKIYFLEMHVLISCLERYIKSHKSAMRG